MKLKFISITAVPETETHWSGLYGLTKNGEIWKSFANPHKNVSVGDEWEQLPDPKAEGP